MTKYRKFCSAGLVFDGFQPLDIVRIGNRISNVFETLDQQVTGIRILSCNCAQVSSQHYEITATILEDQQIDGLNRPASVVVDLKLTEIRPEKTAARPDQDTVLAHTLKALHWSLGADYIKWITPGVLLNSADFVMAISQPDPTAFATTTTDEAAPNRARQIAPFPCSLPNIDETNDVLHIRLAQKDEFANKADSLGKLRVALLAERIKETTPPEDIREKTAPLRLAVWMVSFIVALFALPVGVTLMIINLFKGENLRLVSQTAALTGTFISFQAYGTTAQAMTAIQQLVG